MARLCGALDGLPLAVELAAVRLRALSVQQVLERVNDSYALLSAGRRAVHARQESLDGSIAWSFELCSRRQRVIWSRLTIFAGDFDLEAVEEICADEELARQDILDLVASLVDKSILTREDHDGQARYRLPEPLRQYGQSRLGDDQERLRWRRRHRDYYAGLVYEASREWVHPQQAQWVARLHREYTNLCAALAYGIANPDPEAVTLRMATGLFQYWLVRGDLSQARYWLGRALANGGGPPAMRIRALSACTHLAILQGELDMAADHIDTAAQLTEQVDQLDDAPSLAYITQAWTQGWIAK